MREYDDGLLVIIMENWSEIMKCESCEWMTIVVSDIMMVIMNVGIDMEWGGK